VAAAKAGLKKDDLDRAQPRIDEIPFTSETKRMTTLHAVDGGVRAYTKGAPEVVLPRCTRVLTSDGVVPLDDDVRDAVLAVTHDFASEALRVLAVAVRSDPEPGTAQDELTLLGLVGMIDPPRPEARDAIATCASAGIRAVMITGDHPATAAAVARELGLLTDGRVVLGAELDEMGEEELHRDVETIAVYARVSPAHKLRVVTALQAGGHVVAMTGDGVNDAPALKKADIGVAMGITGTDVTKEAAAMVLTDDNFASIVAAVEEGRVIFANIRKFVFFLMSCNLAEIFVIFFAMILGWPIPLLPIQLLWLNLVTDAFPALALGMEKPEPGVMDQPPRDPQEPILNSNMKKMIVVQSSVLTFSVLGAFYYALTRLTPGFVLGAPISPDMDLSMARTFAFATMISAELLRAFTTRSEHYSVFKIGLFSNKYMNMGVGLSFLLLMLALYGPLHAVFRTQTLGLTEWAIVGGFAILPFAAGEIGKMFLDLGASGKKK